MLIAVIQGLLPPLLLLAASWAVSAAAKGDSTGLLESVALISCAMVVQSTTGPVYDLAVQKIETRSAMTGEREILSSLLESASDLNEIENSEFQNTVGLGLSLGLGSQANVFFAVLSLCRALVSSITVLSLLSELTILLLPIALMSFIVLICGERVANRFTERFDSSSATSRRRHAMFSTLLVSPSAVRESRVFGAAGFLIDRCIQAHRAVAQASLEIAAQKTKSAIGFSIITCLLLVGSLFLICLFAPSTNAGSLVVSIFGMTSLAQYATMLSSSVGNLDRGLSQFCYYLRAVDVIDSRNSVDDHIPNVPSPNLEPALPCGVAIEFEDVWYRYSPDQDWVLRGVSFTVHPGNRIGIVGPNGAGKTTLLKLALGLYRPTSGRVLWNEVDVESLSLHDRQSRSTAVFQDYLVYEMSLRENVEIGNPGAQGDDSEVARLLERVGLGALAGALPQGLDTQLTRMYEGNGVKGTKLSGGQGQRVAIARALHRTSAGLVVLDEASSSLDPDAEYELFSLFSELNNEKRTLLSVSHRLYLLRECDTIITILDGRIAEWGDFEHISNSGGWLANAYEAQRELFTS